MVRSTLPDWKQRLVDRLWDVVDRRDEILSATLVGSFARDGGLESVSDIDLVVVLESLNQTIYSSLISDFDESLAPALEELGFRLRINPTFGPLKLNDAKTAVLHLMIYTAEGHRQHVIQSPFTCLDWQCSVLHRKRSLKEIYPVFALQPHHFFSARRSATEYLKDFREGVISYREYHFAGAACEEVRRTRPMDSRDRHEFAYHILKFLMQNFLKLVERTAAAPDGAALLDRFFEHLPEGEGVYRDLFMALQRRKQALDFSEPIHDLEPRLAEFMGSFERQFRRIFYVDASRHLFFRHARTAKNQAGLFLGRENIGIEPVSEETLKPLAVSAASIDPIRAYSSPLQRCLESLEQLSLFCGVPPPVTDARLQELDYGACDGLTVAKARANHPALFAAWERGEDCPFPGGENSAAVMARLEEFIQENLDSGDGPTVVCTHNGVLRCLVGQVLGIPLRDWYRLRIPHLAPIQLTCTRHYGWFLDLDPQVENQVFSDWGR